MTEPSPDDLPRCPADQPDERAGEVSGEPAGPTAMAADAAPTTGGAAAAGGDGTPASPSAPPPPEAAKGPPDDTGSAKPAPPVLPCAGGNDAAATPAARPPIEVRLFGRTDVGQIREHNEDNFLIGDLGNRLRGITGGTKHLRVGKCGMFLAVCDGMGGAAAGEVASKLATDIIYDRMLAAAGHRDRDQLAIDIVEALEQAGTRILQESNSNRAFRGMGTTATVAALVDDYLLLGQVGDSRGYLLRGGRLTQVTRDQSLVNQLIEAGQLTEEEAENFEHSNIILQALGTADAVQVDLTYVHLRKGDVLLMCSDGLSGMVRDAEIRDTLLKVTDPAEACRVLIDDANQAGGHDNITVVIAAFDGGPLGEPTEQDVESLKYTKYTLPAWADDRAAQTAKVPALSVDDDAPSIEIHGEIEVDPAMDWDDVLGERPSIPKEPGPDMSSMFMVAILVAAMVLVFLLFAL